MRSSPGAFDRAAALLALLTSSLVAQATVLALRAQSADNPLEYEVKAAVIYNFTKFVEWPGTNAGNGADTRFELCLLGEKVVLKLVRDTLSGKLVRGATVAVREITAPAEAAGCDLLFMTQPVSARVSVSLSDAPSGVLTITEAPGLDESGAIINLVLDDGRVAFEIDVGRANQAGFKISSNLLKLARSVERGGRR
jgi:hypothetical protein